MDPLLKFFQILRNNGFTPGQAAGLWQEKYTLASPILWSHHALRHDLALRCIAKTHRQLCQRLDQIQTPLDWHVYRHQFPDFLQTLHQDSQAQFSHGPDLLKCYWSTLAMEEGIIHYEKRANNPEAIPDERDVYNWEDLYNIASRRQALEDLCDHVPHGSFVLQSWQSILKQTGLRSLRWSWGEALEPQARLQQSLLQAQSWLQERLHWEGPVLGLAGRTSLALTNRGKSDGMVQIDHGGSGQTLTVGHWSIVAHEWLHTLDSSLAKYFDLQPSWMTTSLMHWEGEDPPHEAMVAWFGQMECVLLMAPPEEVQINIRQEVIDWPKRMLESLGHGLNIQEEIHLQQQRLQEDTWDAELAELAWLRVLKAQYGTLTPKTLRTAKLLVADTQFSHQTSIGERSGFWAEYLIGLPHEDAEGKPCTPKSEGCMRYLGHPVEIMARSFEAALAFGEDRNAIWIPPEERPNAGLLWPTLAECSRHQNVWQKTLQQIKPVWQEWRNKNYAKKAPPHNSSLME